MSGAHPTEERLNDWAEDLLPPAERAAVDAHIALCTQCRAHVHGLRDLLGDLRDLPGTASPGADLRPGIRAEVLRRRRREALWSVRRTLAAAAALLIVGTAAFTALLVRALDDDGGPASSPPSALAATDGDALGELRDLEREYTRAAEDLVRALESSRGELPPETVRLVEESLATVELALSETRSALAEDPASPVLRELVLAAHRHRLDVLRRATDLAAGT